MHLIGGCFGHHIIFISPRLLTSICSYLMQGWAGHLHLMTHSNHHMITLRKCPQCLCGVDGCLTSNLVPLAGVSDNVRTI